MTHEPAAQTYWNTNIARHPGILREVPQGCAEALDVGCGDGLLVAKLAERAERVTGVDTSPEMIARARERTGRDVVLLEADFLAADLPLEGFDFICSVSTIHHMDFEAALVRMRELLRPGGTLVVVGLARDVTFADWLVRIPGLPAVWVIKKLRRARGPRGMPAADVQMGYRQVRQKARRLLPGSRYRRHLLRRYSVIWQKPGRTAEYEG
ncbi:class I SAM-dependent methyltransferase [Nonomuraea endophytica]|uniref:SAM-dependent methyltransferase n=1 Tax=Nonomuraea endophytica TaxID=714136 RepID=A0A7W8EM37_9ACTN|nr:class I SAM-dependent methyltransferase [Nonomuraea endophytica]MBB5083547.1 SAM-dependent methyltransferase [Nonomuraea endophytica]